MKTTHSIYVSAYHDKRLCYKLQISCLSQQALSPYLTLIFHVYLTILHYTPEERKKTLFISLPGYH